jgi:hypothetical protein
MLDDADVPEEGYAMYEGKWYKYWVDERGNFKSKLALELIEDD